MKSSKIQKRLVLVTLVAGVFAAGCELIVDFDRTRIPVDVAEASVTDSAVQETSSPDDAGDDAADDDAGDPDGGDVSDAADADQ